MAASLAQSGIAKVVLAVASIAAAVLLLSEYWRYMAYQQGCMACQVVCIERCNTSETDVIHVCHSVYDRVRRPQLLLVGNVTVDLVDGKRALVIRQPACICTLSRFDDR
jgi:hypothetical protein